ncbi:helix-turn-helix domain-containing protein [Paenibacillus sinopodophylli]|uniref:helix-turn-helix domain-containing protein n=1 Tax=Paenibacillus sinopodophylli TaxID=1837342 RepID=UPI00110CD82B|nr:helix-turn-helix domain-containing protein [Paenibacillus sinopodophylli]
MKLLIVDDEERTRELLKNYIPWAELGIDQVFTARNGIMALELGREVRPDIVLCDVRMPKMNGIEFAQQYQTIDQTSIFIFLSGFSDKEYLKAAIHLKALNYIEKPVNLDEVKSVVSTAIQLKREERKKQSEDEQLKAGFDHGLPYLRQEMVRKLIAFPTSVHVRPALQSRETFLLPSEGPYTVLSALLYWSPIYLPEDPVIVQEQLLFKLNMQPQLDKYRALFGFDSNHFLIIVLAGAYRSSFRDNREVIDSLYADLKAIAGQNIEVRLGIGTVVQDIDEIPISYHAARQAGFMQFYVEGLKPIFANEVSTAHSPLETNWEDVRLTRDELRKGNLDAVKQSIDQLTERARQHMDMDIVRVKDTFFQLLLAILEVAVQQGLKELTHDAERRYIWKEIDRISNLNHLRRYLLSFLQLFYEAKSGHAEQGLSKMREIIRYIHSHFHENGFNIQQIADHVNLSETYLCSYFKKQRGETIKEFITHTRVEKAKELLLDREVKLYEVAIALGFTDANYFSTFFKRYAGVSPSEYRERTQS